MLTSDYVATLFADRPSRIGCNLGRGKWLYRAAVNADDEVVRRNRSGRGIPRWIIVPNVLGFGGRTRMAGQSEFGRHPHRTPSQRLDVVYAAAITAAVFAILVGVVWFGVWLLRLAL